MLNFPLRPVDNELRFHACWRDIWQSHRRRQARACLPPAGVQGRFGVLFIDAALPSHHRVDQVVHGSYFVDWAEQKTQLPIRLPRHRDFAAAKGRL